MATLEQIAQAQTNFLGELKNNLDMVVSAANRVYSYTHEAIVTDDLEKDYQDIITANPDLANVSAVGLLAILKDGDTVTTHGNRMFINGIEEQTDYSFSGENSQNGIEFIKVWYFENEEPITLQGDCPFDISVLEYKVKTNAPNMSESYKSAQTVISDGNYNISGNCIKNMVFKNNDSSNVIENIMDFYSEQEHISSNRNIFGLNKPISNIILPNVESISNGWVDDGMFKSCKANIYFPKLKSVSGISTYTKCAFVDNGVMTIILPITVERIGIYSFSGNFKLLRLDCKDAKVINDNWCINAQSNFQMCDDWGASINIKTAAAKWTTQNFIDLLSNKDRLRNVGFDIADNNGDADYDSATGKYVINLEKTGAYQTKRYITIPQSMLSSLDSETLDVAFQKGWKVQGG